jgi:type I restriction enzyme M protein
MDQSQLNWIANFIWNIADDVLRDIYVRGKYRDVILPFTVIRRLDAVLEPTKQAVLAKKQFLDTHKIANQDAALCLESDQAFYNVSPFTLRDLKARAKAQQLKSDFEAYLGGYSANVQEIIEKFGFRNQIQKLANADILGTLVEKFLDPDINLSPKPVLDTEGRVKLPGLDNHAMGTVFEELIRRFNEENNEEAGEHFTPRDVVQLMAKLLFLPVADQIESGTYLLYDGACGTGGMLTVAEESLAELARAHGKEVSIHLFGQEINPETYAICKADLLLKGEGAEAEHIVGGEDRSTLSNDAFPSREFDFMLSNPPYGKSWKKDLERMGGKEGIRDPRFIVQHAGEPEFKLLTRSSDGQLLFLANKLAKMKRGSAKDSPLGSRIALVHNGSALFTGDAGQGESNVRRYLLENDWLEAIIALPLNIFYNTGIATYIWVLANRKKPAHKGKVQLIDATGWFKPLRKNLGKKNCELGPADIQKIMDAYLGFEESEHSKVFDNSAFGYWKITVERPLRLRSQFTRAAVEGLRYASGDIVLRQSLYDQFGGALYDEFSRIKPDIEKLLAGQDNDEDEESDEGTAKKKAVPEKVRKRLLDPMTWQRDQRLYQTAKTLWPILGDDRYDDHNIFRTRFDEALKESGLKHPAADKKAIIGALSWRDEEAPPVIAKRAKPKAGADAEQERLYGRFPVAGAVIEYEPDPALRDTEQVPLLEPGGIEPFVRREVLPHASDAWIEADATKIGYEISFARFFHKPQPLRALESILSDIRSLESEAEGLIGNLIGARSA